MKKFQSAGLKVLIIFSFILIGLVGCKNDHSCSLTTIVPIVNSDSLKPGELYQAELNIPDFDSTFGYKCIIADYDTLIDSDGCKLVLDTTKIYYYLERHRSFNELGSFVLLSKKEKIGRHEFNGFVSYLDNSGKEIFMPFQCVYFVYE